MILNTVFVLMNAALIYLYLISCSFTFVKLNFSKIGFMVTRLLGSRKWLLLVIQ